MMRVDINREAETAFEYLRAVCPHASGNMRDTMTLVQTGKRAYRIKIGGAKAPYAVYTNERWISDRWHGRRNPNEKWIDKAVLHIVKDIAMRYRGDDNARARGAIRRWNNAEYHERMERGEG